MTIKEKEQEIIEEFDLFDEWLDKYNYIIDLGKGISGLPKAKLIAENLVSGCNSQVWLTVDKKEDKLFYSADSDAIIPKGIAALLVRMYSGSNPEEIINHNPIFIKEVGLEQHLSPNRANGLVSMINMIKQLAIKSIQ